MSGKIDSQFLNMLNLLRVESETVFNQSLYACKDYEDMADRINDEYKKKNRGNKSKQSNCINETTLRNWWQEGVPRNKPYKSKLSIVAESLGYASWENFCLAKKRSIMTTALFNPLNYKVDEMEKGTQITIGWFPEYFVLFEYLGEHQFKVLDRSPNIKLHIGEEKLIFGFGLQYVEDLGHSVNDDEKIEYIDGYPLYPKLIFRNIPEITQYNEDQSVFICG